MAFLKKKSHFMTAIRPSFQSEAAEFFTPVPALSDATVKLLKQFREIVPQAVEAIVVRPRTVRVLPEMVNQLERDWDSEKRQRVQLAKGAAFLGAAASAIAISYQVFEFAMET